MFWIIFGSAAGAAVVALIVYIICGNQIIRVSRHEVRLDLPETYDGFRISHVSDLHNKNYGREAKRLMDKIRAERPHIIVVSGDIIHTERTRHALDFARAAAGLCPVFYVNGNHEKPLKCYPRFREQLIEAGVRVLDNELTHLSPDGTEAPDGALTLAGVCDPVFFGEAAVRYEKFFETLSALRAGADGPAVLISHRPELIDRYAEAGFDLVLTGHAHGGQVRFPFIGALYAPNQPLLPKLVMGKHRRGNTTEIISRGLGSSNPVPRFHNNPELITVTIRAGENP